MIFIGEINQDYDRLKMIVAKTTHNQSIIQVGDIGLGIRNKNADVAFLTEIDSILTGNNSKLYIIRGNWDYPGYFFMNEDGFGLKNIKLVDDFTSRRIEGIDILFFGGGISIDRAYRETGKNHWYEERIIFEEFITSEHQNIDIVVSHIPPPYMFDNITDVEGRIEAVKHDECLPKLIEMERDGMRMLQRKIFRKYKVLNWVSGHFLKPGMAEKSGIVYKALDEFEVYELNL